MSELMGSLIMIAITLVAGTAVFGFVIGQTGTSAQAVGGSAARNIDFLNERESVVFAAISPPPPPTSSLTARIWVYNSGAIDPENMTSVVVTYPSHVCTVSLRSQAAALVRMNQVSSPILVTLTPSATCSSPAFVVGQTYTFKVLGLFGSTSELTVQL